MIWAGGRRGGVLVFRRAGDGGGAGRGLPRGDEGAGGGRRPDLPPRAQKDAPRVPIRR